MQDLVERETRPGFVHLPPRERLARHGHRKIRERLAAPEFTRADYEALCERFRDGEFVDDLHEQGLDRRDVYRVELLGQRVRVVFDTRYDAVVTVILGWRADQPVRAGRQW